MTLGRETGLVIISTLEYHKAEHLATRARLKDELEVELTLKLSAGYGIGYLTGVGMKTGGNLQCAVICRAGPGGISRALSPAQPSGASRPLLGNSCHNLLGY